MTTTTAIASTKTTKLIKGAVPKKTAAPKKVATTKRIATTKKTLTSKAKAAGLSIKEIVQQEVAKARTRKPIKKVVAEHLKPELPTKIVTVETAVKPAALPVPRARVVYVRNSNSIVGCLAFEVSTETSLDETFSMIRYGISSHNPVDVFNRATGRKMALNRLEGTRKFLTRDKVMARWAITQVVEADHRAQIIENGGSDGDVDTIYLDLECQSAQECHQILSKSYTKKSKVRERGDEPGTEVIREVEITCPAQVISGVFVTPETNFSKAVYNLMQYLSGNPEVCNRVRRNLKNTAKSYGEIRTPTASALRDLLTGDSTSGIANLLS